MLCSLSLQSVMLWSDVMELTSKRVEKRPWLVHAAPFFGGKRFYNRGMQYLAENTYRNPTQLQLQLQLTHNSFFILIIIITIIRTWFSQTRFKYLRNCATFPIQQVPICSVPIALHSIPCSITYSKLLAPSNRTEEEWMDTKKLQANQEQSSFSSLLCFAFPFLSPSPSSFLSLGVPTCLHSNSSSHPWHYQRT